MRALPLKLVLLVALVSDPAPARAHRHSHARSVRACVAAKGYKSWDAAYDSARAVIEAIVVKGTPKAQPATTILDVQRSWKGPLGAGKITVASHHTPCTPYPFTKGERYIVYLDYPGAWPKDVTILRAVNEAWAASDEDRQHLPERRLQDEAPRAIDGN